MITTKEMAQRLGVSVRTIHRKVKAGELTPAAKLPGPTGDYIFEAPVTKDSAA